MRRLLLILVAVAAGGFLLIQLVPYGRNHSNPPVTNDLVWTDSQARELAGRACYDCHSNETVWPWYSNVAPVSWLVMHDTEEGRAYFNVSEWGVRKYESHEAAETYIEGEMPLKIYYPTHPEARLGDVERQELIDGLIATFGGR